MLDNTILISIREYDKELDKVFQGERVIAISDYDKLVAPVTYLVNTVNGIRANIKEKKEQDKK